MNTNEKAPTVDAIGDPQHGLKMTDNCEVDSTKQGMLPAVPLPMRISTMRVLQAWAHANDEPISADDFDRIISIAAGHARRWP